MSAPAAEPALAGSALLARARSQRAAAERAEAEAFATAVAWAALHPDPLTPVVPDPDDPSESVLWETVLSGAALDPARGGDQALELAGPGAPTISELAMVEFAAVLGMSTDAGRRYLGDALEVAHRLPRIHARITTGQLPVWRARRIAQHTRHLSPTAAAFVDARVAPVAHRVGLTVLDRLLEEARARFDPEEAELAALDAAEARHARIHHPEPGHELDALAEVSATLDLADALDLDAAISGLAGELAEHGCGESLDVRRARALGLLARGERPAAAGEGGDHANGRTGGSGRAVTLYVHTTLEALQASRLAACTCATGGTTSEGAAALDLARLENTRGPITADTLREWLGVHASRTTITLRPVIDLRDEVAVDAYEVPDRIAERVRLRRPTCAFPHCTRPAREADQDHIREYVPPDRGGPPGQTSCGSVAPLCRRHHRAKTHPAPTDQPPGRRWRYHRDPLDGSAYLWTSPHGHRFRVDPQGTTGLTPTQPVSAS